MGGFSFSSLGVSRGDFRSEKRVQGHDSGGGRVQAKVESSFGL